MTGDEQKKWDKCPGAQDIRRPKPELKDCPKCGAEIEVWTDEVKTVCNECGQTVYNNINSCIRWCEYAKECIGKEKYESLTDDADVFK